MRCTHLQDESWYDAMKDRSFVSDFGVSRCECGEILRCFRHQIPVQSHDDSSCWLFTDVDVHVHLLGDIWIALDRGRVFCHRIGRQGERRGHQRCGQCAPPVPCFRAVIILDVSTFVWIRSTPRDVATDLLLSRSSPSRLPRRTSRERVHLHVSKTPGMRHRRRRGIPPLRFTSRHICAFSLTPLPFPTESQPPPWSPHSFPTDSQLLPN